MKQQNISFFNRPLFWIILAFVGFALLPSKALDYGLFESTSDELMDAMDDVWNRDNGHIQRMKSNGEHEVVE